MPFSNYHLPRSNLLSIDKEIFLFSALAFINIYNDVASVNHAAGPTLTQGTVPSSTILHTGLSTVTWNLAIELTENGTEKNQYRELYCSILQLGTKQRANTSPRSVKYCQSRKLCIPNKPLSLDQREDRLLHNGQGRMSLHVILMHSQRLHRSQQKLIGSIHWTIFWHCNDCLIAENGQEFYKSLYFPPIHKFNIFTLYLLIYVAFQTKVYPDPVVFHVLNSWLPPLHHHYIGKIHIYTIIPEPCTFLFLSRCSPQN